MVFCLSSTTFQNLTQKFTKTFRKIKRLVPSTELRCLYISQNKITAFEDALTFFPHLFALKKTAVCSSLRSLKQKSGQDR